MPVLKSFTPYGGQGQSAAKPSAWLSNTKSMRFALGVLLLALIVVPIASSITWAVRCHAGGDCSNASWLLLPSCLFQASSGGQHAQGGGRLPKLPVDFRTDKWKAFLLAALDQSSSFSRLSAARKGKPGAAIPAVFEAYPPQEWEPWELPPAVLKSFPLPEAARLDPKLFHLHIKFLTFDRVNTTSRCLASLLAADYEGDVVSFEVFVDHPYHQTEGWRKLNQSMQELALEKRRSILALLDSFAWPHGPKRVFTRSLNGGIQPQWMEAFWPESVNEFAFVVEDDTEVSPFFYAYLKRLIMHYYYTKANYDSHIYGISFQRQWFVPAKDGNKLVSPPDPFLYQLVGTWGQILFPIPWKNFHTWYDVSRYTAGREPILDNMWTTIFWYRKGNSIWTHWQVHWAYVNHMFNLYTGFPGNLSLSVCHRTAGVNIRTSLGPDTEMITADVLLDPKAGGRDEGSDPATGLPAWWTRMPPTRDLALYDFCFRELPRWRTPVTSLEELKLVLPKFNATQDIGVLIVPSSAFSYKLVTNWICHRDGTGLHNYMLLITLLPLRDKEGFECAGAAQLNSGMLAMASELAERNNLVYVQTDLVSSKGHTCIDATDSLFLTRHQAGIVQHLLDSSLNVLVMGAGALWRLDPFLCFREAAERHRISALARILKAGPQYSSLGVPLNSSLPFVGSVIWIEGSAKGAKKWQVFQQLWDKYAVSNTSGLPVEAVEDALKIFHGLAISAPQALSTNPTKECIVAAPWKKAAGAPNSTSPAIILAPEEDSIAGLKKLGLWQLHELYDACTAIKCSTYV